MMKMTSLSRAGTSVLGALLLSHAFQAVAEDFPRLTPELMNELNTSQDTTWPDDPAVPDLPPMPVTDDPKMNQ